MARDRLRAGEPGGLVQGVDITTVAPYFVTVSVLE